MTTTTTFADRGDKIEAETTHTVKTTIPGPIARSALFLLRQKYWILGSLAVGGASYLAYDAVRSGKAKEAADHVADAAGAAARLMN